MAAQVRAFLAFGNSAEFVTLVFCNQARALLEASNSTGRVTSENRTVTANRAIPTSKRVVLPELAMKTPISRIQFTMVELNCTAGTILLLKIGRASCRERMK